MHEQHIAKSVGEAEWRIDRNLLALMLDENRGLWSIDELAREHGRDVEDSAWGVPRRGVPSLREMAYDVEAAAQLRASGHSDAESTLAEPLLDPVSAGEVTARFESAR